MRALHTASFSFDSSWEQLFWLIAGHELHLLDETERRDPEFVTGYVRRHRVDTLDVTPTYAQQLLDRLPEDADPAEAVERALAELPDHPDLHTAAVAVDPGRWELLHIALWLRAAPEDAPDTRYRVHHLSSPELDRLPAGRHW
ncbi:DUF4865 family protein [Kitasatospora sp. NPDC001574]